MATTPHTHTSLNPPKKNKKQKGKHQKRKQKNTFETNTKMQETFFREIVKEVSSSKSMFHCAQLGQLASKCPKKFQKCKNASTCRTWFWNFWYLCPSIQHFFSLALVHACACTDTCACVCVNLWREEGSQKAMCWLATPYTKRLCTPTCERAFERDPNIQYTWAVEILTCEKLPSSSFAMSPPVSSCEDEHICSWPMGKRHV